MTFPQLTVRPATPEDLPYLQHRLKLTPQNEQLNLRCCVVFVAEYGGVIVGFSAARLLWQIEPLMLFDEFRRRAPHHARRRATYSLIKAIDGWIGDRMKNHSGIHAYFCFIKSRVMQKLALSFGMMRAYTGGMFFGRDT